MKNFIIAAMIALAGVSSVQLPAQAASLTIVTGDDNGVVIRRHDRNRQEFRHENRRDRREMRRDRRHDRHEMRRDRRHDRREFRREVRGDNCRTRIVREWRNDRLITSKVRSCR